MKITKAPVLTARQADYIGTNEMRPSTNKYVPLNGTKIRIAAGGGGALATLVVLYELQRVERPFAEWSYVLLIFKEAMPYFLTFRKRGTIQFCFANVVIGLFSLLTL